MTEPALAANAFFDKHRALLERAAAAVTERDYWTPFPEAPEDPSYGSQAEKGEKAFKALLNEEFPLPRHPGSGTFFSSEASPYGFPLGLRYPHVSPEDAIQAAKTAGTAWREASPDTRAGVTAEILARLNAASFEIAHAVQHTTGQPFLMAFQAGGPHAQDRALEAVAYAWIEQRRHPTTALWAKPQRKGDPITMEKTFTPVGRGVGVLIGCNTFPTWNGYPGLFASLATGNPVVIKPHRRAVLPLAITVRIAREVLVEAGFNPDVVILAASSATERTAPALATHPDVRLVDFTGSTEFGTWLEDNARQAHVYTEKAGINSVVLDSTDDYKGLLRNLSVSLSLYSGQMCTAPQNLLVPTSGITTDQGTKTPAKFAADLASVVDGLLSDAQRACGTLGGIVSGDILKRVEEAATVGQVILPSRALTHPDYEHAVVRTPLIGLLDAHTDLAAYSQEWFGPVTFVISTDSTEHSLEVLGSTVREHGALTATVHSTSEDILNAARRTALDAGVHLSENLTGPVFVNHSAAFSDFHGTAANPAATAALTDPAFVTGRFSILQSRRHVKADHE